MSSRCSRFFAADAGEAAVCGSAARFVRGADPSDLTGGGQAVFALEARPYDLRLPAHVGKGDLDLHHDHARGGDAWRRYHVFARHPERRRSGRLALAADGALQRGGRDDDPHGQALPCRGLRADRGQGRDGAHHRRGLYEPADV